MALSTAISDALRHLPSVDRLAAQLPEQVTATVRAALARQAVTTVRARLLANDATALADPQAAALAWCAPMLAHISAPGLARVINATGTVLHTGLGRAPLGPLAQAAARQALAGACQLEFDLADGVRGNRQDHVRDMLTLLTGADSAHVVNNCAGATVLALQALAQGREVIISRGELVEIGGSFRVPEIMQAAGARLVEVGATNKTHLRDYAAAITDQTALLLRVHQSNFEQRGFVAAVDTAELAKLAQDRGIPLLVDQGSGNITPSLAEAGYRCDTVQQELAAGADLVCSSGDKLLGGPQAGLLLGRAALVERCARHPLARAMRCDKVTLAALAGTLAEHAREDVDVPSLARLTGDPAAVRARADQIVAAVDHPGLQVAACRGAVGSGALPTDGPDSWAVIIDQRPEAIHRALRTGTPAVVGRISQGQLWLDCVTVADDEVAELTAALQHALAVVGGAA